MDTNRLKRFATEARNILMQGVAHRFTALGFLPDGNVTEVPLPMGGGATFMGDTVSEDFYQKWCSLQRAVKAHSIEEVAEEAAYTWFNRMVAIRIMVKNGLIAPVLQYESEGVHIPLLVSEARQGRMPDMSADDQRKLEDLLLDDSKTAEQFRILIVAFCHATPVIDRCFGHIADYTELLLPANILVEGGFVDMLNNTEFISEDDYHSPELIGWLYQFYISEKKDDVFANFKKGKKAEAKDIPAATQIFTPNWIVKYMVQNTIGRIYLDNNPYEEDIQNGWKYLVEPSEPTPEENILHYDDLKELKFADLACGSGHILNEGFDMLYDLYVLEGYSRKDAIESIFRYNLTGVDIDTRAKQLAQFALLLKACQKDSSFADAHIMPRVLDMPEPYLYKDNLRETLPHFFLGSNQEMIQEVCDAFDLMDEAKNLGSIMKFNISERTRNAIMIRMEEYEKESHVPETIRQLMPYMSVILALTEKYSSLVANPPYMGRGNMNQVLSAYLDSNYPDAKQDLYSSFMQMMLDKTTNNGRTAFITMESWMFLTSFEKLRRNLLDNYCISSLGHFGWHIIGIAFGTVMTVFQKTEPKNYKGEYSYLTIDDIDKDNNKPYIYPKKDNGRYSIISQKNFEKIPGCVIGYWVSETFISLFDGRKIGEIGISDGQNITGDNNKYLKLFWEVNDKKIGKARKWVLVAKGGSFRRWYGNIIDVINWSEEARNEYKTNPVGRIQDEYLWYREGITWNLISSNGTGFRFLPNDCLFNKAAPTIVIKKDCLNEIPYALGFLNTKVVVEILKIMNPTFNTNIAEVFELPYKVTNREEISKIVENSIAISKTDWDSHETSWDFETNPLVALRNEKVAEGGRDSSFRVKDLVAQFETIWEQRFNQLHENEEELNRQFISIYGLQDELTPDVPLDEITILQQGEISIEKETK